MSKAHILYDSIYKNILKNDKVIEMENIKTCQWLRKLGEGGRV